MYRGALFRRYALSIGAVVAVAVAAVSAAQAFLIYRETQAATASRLSAEAVGAAAQIDRFIDGLVGNVQAVVRLIDSGHAADSAAIRGEMYRLIKLSPDITDARHIDPAGREQARVARFDADAIGSNLDLSREPRYSPMAPGVPQFGPVYLFKQSEPMTTVAVRSRRGDVVAVEVSLKRVREAIAGRGIGATGLAYVVDADGRLLAHPDLNLVLARTDLSAQSAVAAARSPDARIREAGSLVSGTDAAGQATVSTSMPLVVPGWRLIAEQRRSEAFAPVVASLVQSALLLVGALSVGLGASVLLARRAAEPIAGLTAGAERIGGGDLSYRLPVGGRDELGELAAQFNRMAEQLQASYATLEAQVRARTAELSAKKEEAERANAAKTRFLAAASHDLRQPMHTIALLVGLLHERIRFPEVRALVDSIQAAVQAMENLFSSLLDISRLDAGSVQANVRPFAIDEVLRQVEPSFGPQAREKGLRLHVARSRAVVRSDPALLERIVGNLVANGIRYTDRGTVLVGCRRRSGGVELQVCDTGRGIAPEHHETVFEEFFQLDNPERDRSKGLGLGLSIVRRTAELLGHDLHLRSRPGRGSVFGVLMPLASAQEAALARPVEAHIAGGEAGSLDGAFVVVIDDEAQSLSAMAALCRQWGAQVVAADSEASALAQLGDHLRNPDLIITDYRLREGRTGLMAIEAIRAAAGEAVPAIVVTGDLSVSLGGRATLTQTSVLHKPVDVDALMSLATQRCALPPAQARA